MAGNHSLGTIRGTIEIDYDGAGIVKAVRDTDKLKGSGDKLNNAVSKTLSLFGKMSKVVAVSAASSLLLNGGLQVIAGTLAVMGPLITAGVALLPGIMLAAAAAVAVAKIATIGVGDALKAAGEDAEKFNEAIKNLSPEAQKFARAWRSALSVLRPVQRAIQDAFFTGLGPVLTQVTGRVATLKAQAVGVAGALNGIIRNVVKFATSSKSIENVRSILSGVNAFLLRIRTSLGPIVARFIDLAAQASVFGGTLGGQVASALERFAGFLGRIDVAAILERALPILKSLGAFLGNVGTIATQLFSVFNVDGANAAGILGELAAKLAAFLSSAEGQAALQAIGQAMQTIAGSAGQVFLTLLQQLAPIIVALAPGVAQLATQLATVLVPALETLGPILTSVSGFLSDNMSWLGPIAGVVLVAAAAYRTYTAAVKAWAAAEAIAQTLRLKAVATWVATTAATIANTVATGANAAIRAGAFVASWVASTAVMVANRVAMLASTVVMGIVKIATIAWTAVQWALNVALLANPIGLIIIAIALFVAGIILLWKKSETFRTIVLAVWAAIKIAVKAVADWFMNSLVPFLKKVWDLIVKGVKFAVDLVVGYFNFWKTVITTVVNAVKNIITFWRNAVVAIWQNAVDRAKAIFNGISTIVSKVAGFFSSMRSAVIDRLSSLISFIKGIPGRVSSALGNLGSLLYNKGKQIIQGLINGIKSMFGAVSNVVSSIVSKVTSFLPGSPAKEGPLSGKGYSLYRGRSLVRDFASGILDAEATARRAMQRVMNSAAINMPTTTPTLVGTTVAPTPAVARVAPVTVAAGTTVQTLNVPITGVWDLTDPMFPRQVAAKIHTAIESYKKEHR